MGLEDDENARVIGLFAIGVSLRLNRSIINIRTLVMDAPQFVHVIRRLSDIIDRNLWLAVSNIEDKEGALRKARANLEFLEARMERMESTGSKYRFYFMKRCGVIDFMSFLGGANSVSNERSEALAMLRRDMDLIIEEPFFVGTSLLLRGQEFVADNGNTLFVVNYLWKVQRITQTGNLNPSLPSFSAFYSLEGLQVSPTLCENVAGADEMVVGQRYPDTGDLRPVYEEGMLFDIYLSGLIRESARDLNCVICLDDVDVAEECRLYPCFHGFHRHCIDELLSRDINCPICRQPALNVVQS